MKPSIALRRASPELWESAVVHPFIEELGAGTLPIRKFRHYMVQDYIFVRDLVKVTALAVAKAPDLNTARPVGAFLDVLLGAEDALFKRTFRDLKVPERTWRSAEAAPLTAAFGDYLVALAYSGTFREICTAMSVTEGVYMDWATRLHAAGVRPGVDAYEAWMDIHTEEALGPTVQFLNLLVDGASAAELPKLQEIFDRCCQFETGFWDMAYSD